MNTIQLDHFLTFTNTANIDDYMDEYSRLGFVPDKSTTRHEPGLRNRFIFLGPEYIEFCWVEDEELFAQADEDEKLLRIGKRPFGVGMVSEDIHATHAGWAERGFSVPEVWSKAPRDAAVDAPPRWSFQDIPSELLPGAICFALTYHYRPKGEIRHIIIHPNTIFAISGVTFVSTEPEARATYWRELLAPGEPIVHIGPGIEVSIPPHRAAWMSPEAYQTTFGLPWVQPAHPFGELAVLHLLAADLEVVKQSFTQAGRQVSLIHVHNHPELLVAPDVRDGFIFSILQQTPETWLHSRIERTGENLAFV